MLTPSADVSRPSVYISSQQIATITEGTDKESFGAIPQESFDHNIANVKLRDVFPPKYMFSEDEPNEENGNVVRLTIYILYDSKSTSMLIKVNTFHIGAFTTFFFSDAPQEQKEALCALVIWTNQLL